MLSGCFEAQWLLEEERFSNIFFCMIIGRFYCNSCYHCCYYSYYRHIISDYKGYYFLHFIKYAYVFMYTHVFIHTYVYRLTAPAQLVFTDPFIELKVWIGNNLVQCIHYP